MAFLMAKYIRIAVASAPRLVVVDYAALVAIAIALVVVFVSHGGLRCSETGYRACTAAHRTGELVEVGAMSHSRQQAFKKPLSRGS